MNKHCHSVALHRPPPPPHTLTHTHARIVNRYTANFMVIADYDVIADEHDEAIANDDDDVIVDDCVTASDW